MNMPEMVGYNGLHAIIERAIAERHARLTSEEMEILEPHLLPSGSSRENGAVVANAHWHDPNTGKVYRVFIKDIGLGLGWKICGTQELDWSSWGRLHMVRPQNRYGVWKPSANTRISS